MPAKKLVTKDMILRAALKLLREEGYEAVNIKALAGELGCSTQPVYLSFSGMEELRAALVPLAAAEFGRLMRGMSADGVVRLYDMAYIRLAKAEPRLFRFLFMRSNAFSEIRQVLLPMTEEAMAELAGEYHLDREAAHFLHDQLWMHAHGIASMVATAFCDWDMDKVGRMLAESRRAFTVKYES